MAMQITQPQAIRYMDYADRVGVGAFVSRASMAALFDVAYSTATYHLEKAVSEGLLKKVVGYIGNQTGWLYCLPETQSNLL